MLAARCFAAVAIPSAELGVCEGNQLWEVHAFFYPVPTLILVFVWTPVEKRGGEQDELGLLLLPFAPLLCF